ncbi:hypothetical protein GH5_06347 [Leishmania sp. Ghana 2012 LV757]|uniref:hypothetical protein n=1 Tax=Leishmania sp. Ghana 2012 LV757 TaxID=2803181 RepID=UPI001B487458|nr:hypothetical protein GH5_06347 [Leishmania sp. Ghana 2012 LV757]
MLSRHGTRLDIGTAEDIAELNAAEALLRTSFKSSTVAGSSGGDVSAGGYYTRGAPSPLGNLPPSGNDTYSGGARSVGAGSAVGGALHASPGTATAATTDFTGPEVGGVARSNAGMPSGTAATSGTASPPHVNLGYPAERHSSGVTNAGSASTPSAAGGYAQRVLSAGGLARSEEGSPSSRTTGASGAGAAVRTPGGGSGVTGVAPSSGSGMRASAPAFYRPQMSMEGAMYRPSAVTAYGAEEDKGREESEEVVNPERDAERGRSSIRGFYASPTTATPFYPTAAAGARLPRPQQSQRAHASPYAHHVPHDSVAAGRAGAGRGGRGSRQGGRRDDEEDNEEASSRPSRVSGRYHFTRPDAP